MNGDTASILMIIGLIIFGIATIYFSTSKKAVVFWDGKDLILTTLAWLIVPLTTMAFREGNVFSIIALIISIILFIRSIVVCVKKNRSVPKGIFVGLFKNIFALFGIFLVLGFIADIRNREDHGESLGLLGYILWTLVLGLFAWFARRLINGPAVYIAKGWALPSDSAEVSAAVEEDSSANKNNVSIK